MSDLKGADGRCCGASSLSMKDVRCQRPPDHEPPHRWEDSAGVVEWWPRYKPSRTIPRGSGMLLVEGWGHERPRNREP